MELAERYAAVKRRMAQACERAGRPESAVTLLAVSKGQPPGAVEALAGLGQTLFGENRVQEAKAKIPQCPSRLRWHMIGHLQSNKCRDAVEWFGLIHSVDSRALAEEIHRWAERAARQVAVLLEVNVAGEASKYGFSPERVLAEIEAINALPRLEIHGLMTLAPWSQDPERARPVFRKLRELRTACEARLGAPLPHLSMGMTGDFEVAIEEGATLVRIGTALFGERRFAR